MTMGSGGIYGTPQQQVQFPLFAGKGFGMGPFANMYTRDPRQALAYNLMAQGASAAPVQHWTQGAARLAQALVGGLIDNRTREEYEGRNRKLGEDTKAIFAPVQMPANEMDNGGERPATLTEMLQRASQTANPDLSPLVQQLALGHATQQAEDSRFKSRLAMELEAKKAEREAQPETFGAPTAMRGPNGPVMVQVGNRGTVRPVTGYAPTDQTANTPASLQEWAAFQRMTPEQQAQYLTMKRANPYLNLGGQMVQPNPVQPGVAMGGFDKTLPPEQTPQVKGEQAAAVDTAKAQVEKQTLRPKAEAALTDLERKSSFMTDTINKALDLAKNSAFATGWGSIITGGGSLPGPARELNNYLDTIKANIGFDRLQQMRENSPTGGALGSVSDNENRLLQAVQGALDPLQAEQLVQNLEIIKQLYPQVLAERRAAFDKDYGDGQQAQPPVPPPANPPNPGTPPGQPPRRLRYNPATGALE